MNRRGKSSSEEEEELRGKDRRDVNDHVGALKQEGRFENSRYNSPGLVDLSSGEGVVTLAKQDLQAKGLTIPAGTWKADPLWIEGQRNAPRPKVPTDAEVKEWFEKASRGDLLRILRSIPNPPTLSDFFTDDAMRGAVVQHLGDCQESVRMNVFCIDDEVVVGTLCNLAKRGIPVLGILDGGQFNGGSCASQHEKQDALLRAGCRLRTWKSGKSGFVLAHLKRFVVDRKFVITGSVNPTKNGFNNNKEELYVHHCPTLVNTVIRDFDETFKDEVRTQAVTSERTTQIVEKKTAALEQRAIQQAERAAERAAARNKGKDPLPATSAVTRDLTDDFANVPLTSSDREGYYSGATSSSMPAPYVSSEVAQQIPQSL